MSKIFRPSDVLYDPINNKLLVYSGHIVQDEFGQDALFCHDRPWNDNAQKSRGVIYTCWLAQKYLKKIGNLL